MHCGTPFALLMIGQRQAPRTAYGPLLKERDARTVPPVRIPAAPHH